MEYEVPFDSEVGGLKINFTPWFDSDYRFTLLHLYEELGGEIASGHMELELAKSEKALKLLDTQKTGTLTITGSTVTPAILDIYVYIYHIDYDNEHKVTMDFVCEKVEGDENFYYKKKKSIYTSIDDIVHNIYPGVIEIRTETDIQEKDPKYWQNDVTDHDFLTRFAYAWKKDSVFGYSWDRFFIKDTKGKLDSHGNEEVKLWIHGDKYNSDMIQLEPYYIKYKPDLYNVPIDIWNNKEIAKKDYSKWEAVNPKVMYKFGELTAFHNSYYQLHYNIEYNRAYMNSDIFQGIKLICHHIPEYRLGDVVEYKKDYNKQPDPIKWNFKYYLVKSNELFIALDGSNAVDEYGAKFTWTSKLLGIEEDGSIALGKETDDKGHSNPKAE